MMGYGLGMGSVVMVIIWVVVIGLAMWLLSTLFPRVAGNASQSSTDQPNARPDAAIDILKQRYARGEITKEQFEQMRLDLDA